MQTRKGKRVTISGYEYSKLATRDYRDLHDIGRLMLLTGARPGEVMQARVEHVNVEQGTWFIPKSKSASGKRVLRLSSEAQSIMTGRIAQFAQSGWIFPGKKAGTHLLDVEHAHQAVLDATCLAFVVYDLRHVRHSLLRSNTRRRGFTESSRTL